MVWGYYLRPGKLGAHAERSHGGGRVRCGYVREEEDSALPDQVGLSATRAGKRSVGTVACWTSLRREHGEKEAGRAEKSGGAGDSAAAERWAKQLLGHGKESNADLGQIQEREKRENKILFLIFSTQFQIQFKSKFKLFCKF